jgi:hypothetical protein
LNQFKTATQSSEVWPNDIADIYRDLKKGPVFNEASPAQPEDAIWTWRVLFFSHWGQHAMDALLAIQLSTAKRGLSRP